MVSCKPAADMVMVCIESNGNCLNIDTHWNTKGAASGVILGDAILLKDTRCTAGVRDQTNDLHITGASAEILPELEPLSWELRP